MKPHLSAGLVRCMELPVCWCASSQSHREDLVGNRTERNLRQKCSFLQNRKKPIIYLYGIIYYTFTNIFSKTFLHVFCPSLLATKNEVKFDGNHPSLTAREFHLWLNHYADTSFSGSSAPIAATAGQPRASARPLAPP